MDTPGQKVINDFIAILERMIDDHHDDADDLASWAAALTIVRAKVDRKLAEILIEEIRARPTAQKLLIEVKQS